MRLFGFKRERFRQWMEVIREESAQLTIRDKARLFLHIAAAGLGLGHVSRNQWRARLRTCRRCPLFDRRMKRCRPWTGYAAGCGCYVPFLALAAAGCWGYRNPGSVDFGPVEERVVKGWGPAGEHERDSRAVLINRQEKRVDKIQHEDDWSS